MTTYEMLKKAINIKANKGGLTEDYIEQTKTKLDVFLMSGRISDTEYTDLLALLG